MTIKISEQTKAWRGGYEYAQAEIAILTTELARMTVEMQRRLDLYRSLETDHARLTAERDALTFQRAALLPSLQRAKELFDAAPWLGSPENRDSKITGCLNITWGDLAQFAALGDQQSGTEK